MAILTWILIVIGLVNAVVGMTVFRRARQGVERYIFLAVLLAVALWSWGLGVFMIAAAVGRAQIYVNIYYTAAMLIATSAFVFGLFEAGVRRKLAFVVACTPGFVWMVLLLVVPHFVVRVVAVVGPLSDRVELLQPTYALYTLTFLAYVGAAIALLYGTALGIRGAERRRLLLVAHGVLLSIAGGALFDLILPWMGMYELIYVGPLFSFFFALSVTYSIVRYSWLDVRRSFLLSLAYVLALATLAAIYGVMAFFASRFVSDGIHDIYVVTLINSAVMFAAVLLFQPLRVLFDKLTDKVFFQNDYQTAQLLGLLSRVVAQTIRPHDLLREVAQLLSNNLKPLYVYIEASDAHGVYRHSVGVARRDTQAERAAIEKLFKYNETVYFFDGGHKASAEARILASRGVAVVVVLRSIRGDVGYIVLGSKLSGVTYHEKDREFLDVAANEIAVAIENSLRYEVIKNFNDTLRARVDEATSQLRHTNQKLKTMDQTKDEFVSLASHQLRTPLTTIKGYISMLLDGDTGPVTPPQRKLLEEAFSSSQRMVHLIGEFLNVSRIQTGKFALELTEVNLADVLNEEIEPLRMSARSRGIVLMYEKPAHFPTMQVDENKIRQVMMNFIDNAIYYSRPGGKIQIILSYTRDYIEFKVIDEGIGVPKDEQHKLFTKFSRASNARKQRPDGTGIGLFMAKKVIVALGGAVLFKSEENKGSTFGFRLNRS